MLKSNNSDNSNILEVKNLKVYFATKIKDHTLKAVDDISFTLQTGETLGVVGESGCGKSTLGRAILQLIKPTAGEVIYHQEDLVKLTPKQMLDKRKDLQIIFQDPLASLDPRMTVGQIIAEPLKNFYPNLTQAEIHTRVHELMEEVGLIPEHINRYPHEFSGGQCQRIGIARALILKPKIIVCDEPVSALDVSIQAQIINLLKSLQKKYGLALIFIAHDLSIVRHISDRILVMYLGKVVELANSFDINDQPLHPYTRALLSAVPIPDPRLERSKKVTLLTGDLPSPLDPPSGCRFRTRCPLAYEHCALVEPVLKNPSSQLKLFNAEPHVVACHLY
jgi:oligopeptide transport system ATP-binding protein